MNNFLRIISGLCFVLSLTASDLKGKDFPVCGFTPGDANRDGYFDGSDLTQIYSFGKYEEDMQAIWEEGDFNGNGLFESNDLVLALQGGKYNTGRYCNPVVGAWFQVSQPRDCSDFCSELGRTSILSPEGHTCTSGELIPASALGVVRYAYGVWPNGLAHGAPNGRSFGRFCYGTDQKKDSDRTDLTVGCFCR